MQKLQWNENLVYSDRGLSIIYNGQKTASHNGPQKVYCAYVHIHTQ